MPTEVWFLRSAARDLEALDRNIQRRLAEEIDRLALDPTAPGTQKLAGTTDLWRSRVGDYRIIYQLKTGRIVIARIAKRGDIYRDLSRLQEQLRKLASD